jgi:hypothetical protein
VPRPSGEEQVSPRLSVWRNEAEAPVFANGLNHSGCHLALATVPGRLHPLLQLNPALLPELTQFLIDLPDPVPVRTPPAPVLCTQQLPALIYEKLDLD